MQVFFMCNSLFWGKTNLEVRIMGERTSRVIFDGEKARIKLLKFDACEAVRIGAAAALHFKGNIGVMADERSLAAAKSAIISGITKTDAQALDLGMGFGALLSHCIRKNKLDGGIMLNLRDGTCGIYFYDRYGLKVSFESYNELKKLHGMLPDGVLAADIPTENAVRCDVSEYTDDIASFDLSGISLHFDCANIYLSACAKEVFERCGAKLLSAPALGHITLCADREGHCLWGKDEKMRPITKNELGALLIRTAAENGVNKMAYSYLYPTFCDSLCDLYGIEYSKVYDIAHADDTYARKCAAENALHFDAIMAAVQICGYLKEKNIELLEAKENIPCGVTKVQNIWIPSSRKDYVIRRLSGRIGSAARVRVLPCVTGGLRLMVEAYDEESADELCCFYKNEIYRLAENADE